MERNSPLTQRLIADGLKPRQEAVAYERLRDAAPDLLRALKGARDALDAIPEGRRGNHDAAINRALRRADEAIAKATGQTQDQAA